MRAQLLALSPLTEEAQAIIAKSKDVAMVSALATSPYLHPSVATLLYANKSPLVRHMALRVLDDVNVLVDVASSAKPCCRQEAALNPLLPAELLSTFLAESDIGIAIAAAINPSTPENTRREILTPERCAAITDVREPLARSVVRASMLALANPWLAEKPELHCSRMLRSFTGLPHISKDMLFVIKQRGHSKFLDRHPAFIEPAGSALTVDELIALGSPAADMQLVNSPNLSVNQASALAMRHPVYPESHVIGLLVRRFGASALAHGDRRRIAGTRMESAWWVEPTIRTIAQMRGDLSESIEDAGRAADILAESESSWYTFLRMQPGWEGKLSDLANAARVL